MTIMGLEGLLAWDRCPIGVNRRTKDKNLPPNHYRFSYSNIVGTDSHAIQPKSAGTQI